ncbi:hypothetical protein N0V88_004737 [Collariella sp. IMI 366227]|nr:hypothetical protein N0V88_004737 [Collariella sp. IMI 366227]
MHKDAAMAKASKTLEYIDVDDYAIACGGVASTSKLNAAFKALHAAPPPGEGVVNGTGKTHHFAVKNRDERIDWMRELMLAKARKQKGEGFEVSVNGNMI